MSLGSPIRPQFTTRIFVEILIVIASCAVGVMLALPWVLPGVGGTLEALADAFLLTATAGPLVYWRVSHHLGRRRPETDSSVPSTTRVSTSSFDRADRRRAFLEAAVAGVLLFFTGAIACLGLWQATRGTIRENVQEELERLAGSAASVIDPALHRAIVEAGATDTPDYLRAVAPLRSMSANVPGLRYVYTLVLDGETPRFVLDAARPGDHDGDGVEDRSVVLEEYEDPDPVVFRAFGSATDPGRIISTGEAYTDKWGSFITGYAPLRDEVGRPYGIVGVDFDASSYLQRLAVARNRALLGTVPALLVALFVGVGVFLVRVRMLRSVRQLAESELRFRSTADASPALVWTCDTTGACDWFNRSWLEFTGVPMADQIGEGWARGVHPEDRERCVNEFRRALMDRDPFHMDYRLRRADGEYRTVEDRGAPNLSPSGEFLGYVGMAIDVTDRLRAEQALAIVARTNARLAAAVDVVDDALCVTDATGCITYVNRGFERQTGWAHDEVLGLRPSILKSGEVDDAVYRDLWSTIRQGRTWSGRLLNRRRDHAPGGVDAEGNLTVEPSLYWAETTITPVTDSERRITGFVSLQRDVTKEVEQEETARLLAEGAEARAAVASILANEAPIRERLEGALRRLLSVRACGTAGSAAVLVATRRREVLEPWVQIGRVVPASDPDAGESGAVDTRASPVLDLARRAANSSEICVLAACAEGHDEDRACAPIRGHGHYAVPLLHAGKCEGVLILSSWTRPDCAPALLDSWRQIGEIVALALVKERAANLLVEAMKKSDAASRAKSEFLANMSHEIRTPLTAILGYSEVLSEDPEHVADPVRRGKTIDTIRSAGQHLLSVVNDILDISKIEAGRMTIEDVDTDVAKLLHEAVSLLHPRAVERGLELRLEFESAMPSHARTDPTRLRQVLMNLVGNAIKFTEKGSVVVRASVANPWGETVLRVSVEDTGPGLSGEERDRLFHAFSQGDSSVTRRHGGTGLGLVICKRLTRLMGGDVELTRTQPGVGTVFTATFRVHVAAEASMTDAVPSALPSPRLVPPAPLPKLVGRVLLAEDGRDNQRLISLKLRKAGAHVDIADNGRIALEMLASAGIEGRPYDLLVTDVQMPEMDGLTLVKTLRDAGSTMPVVALTAHAMAEDRERCLEAGCDGFATKPVDGRELLPLCARLIELSRAG